MNLLYHRFITWGGGVMVYVGMYGKFGCNMEQGFSYMRVFFKRRDIPKR